MDADHLLLVASDRVSAFDVVMREPIPRKGAVLTQLSAFWFERLARRRPVALSSPPNADEILARGAGARRPRGRDRRAARCWCAGPTPVPFECVVRGYLSGSAWAEYREPGTLAGEPLPAGPRARATGSSRRSSRPPPRPRAGHDENVTFDRDGRRRWARRWPRGSATRASRSTAPAATTPPSRGIIIADTKFEFGIDADGTLLLIDEVLTPDSLPLLAGRPLRAGPEPAQLRQAAAARLPRRAQGARAGGTARRRRRRCRPRSSRRPAGATSRRSGCSPAALWRMPRDPHRPGGALVHRRGVGRRAGADRGRGPAQSAGWIVGAVLWLLARGLGRRLLPRSRSAPGPAASDLIVAPADGKVVSVIEIDEPAFFGGRAPADLDLHERVRLPREPVSDRRHGRVPALQPRRVRPRRRRRRRAWRTSSRRSGSRRRAARCSSGRSPGSSPGGSSPTIRSARRCTRASGWA